MELPAAGARARVSARRAAKPAVRGQRAAPARPCSRIEITGLRGVRDCTAGFKAIRATALRAAKVQEISVLGYAFQVALLQRLLHAARGWWKNRSIPRPRARGDQARPGESAGCA